MNIIPFGDSEAHGAIGNTIVFQRRRGGVFARKYTWKKYTRTTAQDKQRTKFRNCIDNYTALSPAEKEYYDMLAYGKKYTGQNLFVSRCLLTPGPSTTPLVITSCDDLHIIQTAGPLYYSFFFAFLDYALLLKLAEIRDNQNTYHLYAGSFPTPSPLSVYIYQVQTLINIPAGYSIDVTWDTSNVLRVYFPEIVDGTTLQLFIADDGSTYYDSAFTNLAYAAP